MRGPAQPGASPAAIAAARTLSVDGWTVESVGALQRANVPCILLKGAAIQAWLYEGEVRPYGDADLLVPPHLLGRARSVLAELGYEEALNEGEPDPLPSSWIVHSRPWVRRTDGATIDLHHTLWAVPASAADVWKLMADRSRLVRIGTHPVLVPEAPALALIVVLHALQHEGRHDRPLHDLERALALAGPETWHEARELALELNALGHMARGLRLLPGGERLAHELHLPDSDIVALEGGPAAMALGFDRMAAAGGGREKLRFLGHELAPSASFMRWWRPWAGRGRIALALAYVYRLGWLATHAIPGYLAWRRRRHRHAG